MARLVAILVVWSAVEDILRVLRRRPGGDALHPCCTSRIGPCEVLPSDVHWFELCRISPKHPLTASADGDVLTINILPAPF